jgi:hypothetical protein
MAYRQGEARDLLGRTPAVLSALLSGLPEPFLVANEGPETFSAVDILGHLIHGERTDWIPRMRRILEHGESVPFDPFDRFAQAGEPRRTVPELLADFARLRAESLSALAAANLAEADLDRRGLHPALGAVTLRQHLSSWVVHDLGHLAQAARVMAKRYQADVGPWGEYLPILSDRVKK